MKETTVSLAQAVTAQDAQEAVLPARVQEAWSCEGGTAGAVCRRRARRAGRADGRGSRRGRRPAGQAGSRSGRGAPRPRGARGDARRAPGGGRAAARPQRRWPQRAAASDLRPLRRPRSADQGRAGADARRRLDPPLPAHARAGRRRARAGCALDVEVGGLAGVRRAHTRGTWRADGPPARRRTPGGDDAGRGRAEGAGAPPSLRSGSRPTGSRSRSGCGRARPRTRRLRRRCSRISSSAASTPSRGCCS